MRFPCSAALAPSSRQGDMVDQSLNPVLLRVKPSKTVAFGDMALQLKEQGVDVSLDITWVWLGIAVSSL